MDIFGYSISKKEPAPTEKSFVPPSDDGSYDTFRAGGHFGTYLDLDGASKTEGELIKKYRDIAAMADCDMAIEDIINESIANIDNDTPVKVNLERVKLSLNIKKLIEDEFKNISKMFEIAWKTKFFIRFSIAYFRNIIS